MKKTLCAIVLMLSASSAYADSMTSCVTSMNDTKISAKSHIEFAVWIDPAAGCHASTDRAWSTQGVHSVEYFDDGSEVISIFAKLFGHCGSYQVDARIRDDEGRIITYLDLPIFNTGVNCESNGRASSSGFSAGSVRSVSVVSVVEKDVDGPIEDVVPVPGCIRCSPEQHTTPVPEASTLVLSILSMLILVLAVRR